MTDKLLVMTTAGSEVEANKIAQALVERRLAACVNIIPRIQSIYRWKDKLERSEEFLLFIKTKRALEPEIQSAIRELHSYELPEHIGLAIEYGSEAYLAWIDESATGTSLGRS
jgi:periplasmic divalent cation tolerance protein